MNTLKSLNLRKVLMTAVLAGSFVSPAAFAKTNAGPRLSKTPAGHVRVAKATAPQMKLQKAAAPSGEKLAQKKGGKVAKKQAPRGARKRLAKSKLPRPGRRHQAGNTKTRHTKRKVTKA